jgi:transcription elongation factor GreA
MELTREDMALLRRELDHRRLELRPRLIEAVKEARAFGDLSENFEYKAAKGEKNRNDSRIRYLERVLAGAVLVEDRSGADTVGLYDRVTLYLEEEDSEELWQLVTPLRQDVLQGRVSSQSPVGRVLLGAKAGQRLWVQVSEDYGYHIVVRSIEKGCDDGSAPLNRY